jgi:hypothetical protein
VASPCPAGTGPEKEDLVLVLVLAPGSPGRTAFPTRDRGRGRSKSAARAGNAPGRGSGGGRLRWGEPGPSADRTRPGGVADGESSGFHRAHKGLSALQWAGSPPASSQGPGPPPAIPRPATTHLPGFGGPSGRDSAVGLHRQEALKLRRPPVSWCQGSACATSGMGAAPSRRTLGGHGGTRGVGLAPVGGR